MTTPVATDDLIQGATKWLAGFSDVLAVLGSGAFNGTVALYLFQHVPYKVMEGTQSTAAVLARGGGFNTPNTHNSMRFERLSLELLADPLRNAGGNPTQLGEVQRRVYHAYTVIDVRLHRPQAGVQMWGTVRTLSCTRLTEPVVYPVSEGGGLVRLQTFYGVTLA